MKIQKIYTGGQTGVERAALDAAHDAGITVCGWVPSGGLTDDYPEPPGITAWHPELTETPDANAEQPALWSICDSDAVLVITTAVVSPGTAYVLNAAKQLKKPCLKFSPAESYHKILLWLDQFDHNIELNITGPKESEFPGIYNQAYGILMLVLQELKREQQAHS